MNEHDALIWLSGLLATALLGLAVKYRRDTQQLHKENEDTHKWLRFNAELAVLWQDRATAAGWERLEPFCEVVKQVVPEDL